ncbi:MAG TPA: recombination protein RecR [Gammaproteobacteria bacterium]|nr:recombination protein RecR [Gammaproteobacteria bacterium]
MSLVEGLIRELQRLPGVGPKSARRMAFHLLVRDRDGARQLASIVSEAADRVGHCSLCRNLTEHEICGTCASAERDGGQLCVVESAADVQAIESAAEYRGRYFVLMGHFSPLDGIGPEELGMDQLEARLDSGEVKELILATNATLEGNVTAQYIAGLAEPRGISVTRIAHGVPMGGELEFVDGQTLRTAFNSRRGLE